MGKVSSGTAASLAALAIALAGTAAQAQTSLAVPPGANSPQATPVPDSTQPQAPVAAPSPDTTEQPAGKEEPAQDVVVTGFRSSLQKALNLKREAIGVRDSIVAEDIGKFPESNVAESLQRIPGVFLSRDGASNEGQRISIRGLGSQYSVTTINGAPVRTTSSSNVGGATRDFNFDVFPSELFGRVDVYKTPLASLEDGGIGGNVDLQTPRAFDNGGKRQFRYTLQGQYDTTGKKVEPRGSVLLSDTWGNFGFLAGVAYAKNVNSRSGFQSTGGYNTPAIGANNYITNRPSTTPIGPFPFQLDYASPRANLGSLTQTQVDNAFLPRFFRAYASTNTRERLGATASLQYKTDNLDISLDGIYANLTDARDEFTYGVGVRNSRTTNRSALPGRTGNSGLIPLNVKIDANNNLYGTFGNADYLSESYYYDDQTKFYYGILRGVWDVSSRLKVSGQANYSRSRASYTADRILTDIYGVDVTYDPTVNYVYPTFSSSFDPTSPSAFAAAGNNDPSLSFVYNTEVDEQKTARLLVDYTPEALGKLELHARVGGSYVASIKDAQLRDGSSLASTSVLPNGQTFRQLDIFSYMNRSIPGGAIPNGGNAGFPSNWANFPRSFVLGVLNANGFNSAAAIRTDSSFRAEEDVAAGFFEIDGKYMIGSHELRGNVGWRYTDTRTIIDNAALVNNVYTPQHRTGGYSYWLPSLSLAFDVTPKVVLRGSAGKTITRASLSNIAGNTRIPNRFDAYAVSGNPDLKPQVATQFDATAEWYFAQGGILSAGYFNKTLRDTTSSQTVTVPFGSLNLPNDALGPTFQDATGTVPASTPVSLATFYNSGTVKLNGLEFAYQQSFRFLPKPFDGLGLLGSFTHINSQGYNFVTTDGKTYGIYTVPKVSYSITGYYEKGPFSIRGSYNYKGRYIIETSNTGNNLERWHAGQGFLDGTVSYRVNDLVELRVDVLNLTNTLVYDYFEDPRGLNGNSFSRLDNALYNGRTITFGIRGKF